MSENLKQPVRTNRSLYLFRIHRQRAGFVRMLTPQNANLFAKLVTPRGNAYIWQPWQKFLNQPPDACCTDHSEAP